MTPLWQSLAQLVLGFGLVGLVAAVTALAVAPRSYDRGYRAGQRAARIQAVEDARHRVVPLQHRRAAR